MDNWIDVNDRLPKNCVAVLIAYKPVGQRRAKVMSAQYHRGNSINLHFSVDPYEGCTYDDEADQDYAPAGWYELEHVDEDAMCSEIVGVTHWQPLPSCGGGHRK